MTAKSDASSREEEIREARAAKTETRRPSVQALEEILFASNPVLDHGFVRVIDYMGDDGAVVQAARVSYGRGTRRVTEDRDLIRYLMRHSHTTPFEMCEIKLHVKLPIFVARQWIRHRMANVNEYSARYSILDNEFYLPRPQDLAAQSKANRQGRGAVLVGVEADRVLEILSDDAERTYRNYRWILNEGIDNETQDAERQGLSRELARINLTLNTYTQWYWKIDLHNLLHFLRLRADAHAQFEIRAYAESILSIVKRWVPVTYEAFTDYQLGAATLSRVALDVVRHLVAGGKVQKAPVSLSKREWAELKTLLGLDA